MVRTSLTRLLLALLFLPACASPQSRAPRTVPALFLSDIHFDPFHDPAKAPQLAAAPVEEWPAILSSSPSPNQSQAFAALQKTCVARAPDTSYELFQSALKAIKTDAASARFVTISGDILAHQFDCRYEHLVRPNDPAGYAAFVEKTLRFVMLQLQAVLPGTPVYMAMGNNDSACGDYRMDLNYPFLVSTAKIVGLGLPPSRDRAQALRDFVRTGEYAVSLPIRNTRLLVLDDLFLSTKYAGCNGRPNPAASEAQLLWLHRQLTIARQHHQRVWVLGHIPPGIDLYSTAARMKGLCSGAPAVTFLSSPKLAETLFEGSSIIKLALFGHTHMDELRLFHPEGDPSKSVPIKMVASITPVNGNLPSFTIAAIDPAAATLIDYRVITSSNHTGVDATWSQEYDYEDTFHQSNLTAASLTRLTDNFQADPTASTPASRAYIANYLPGDASGIIKPLWPQYTCALTHDTSSAFAACACSAPRP